MSIIRKLPQIIEQSQEKRKEIVKTKIFPKLELLETNNAVNDCENMIVQGELKLSDPVSMYLPDSVKFTEKDGKTITLKHLATHTSGLPRFPENFIPKDPQNPYKDYTISDIYQFLNDFTVK